MCTDLTLLKKQLRRECKQLRVSLGENYQAQSSATICRIIEGWMFFERSDTILTYMPMGGEVDLTQLLRHYATKQWAIPRILPGGQMVFHAYDPAWLIRHSFGMLEPDPDCPLIPSEAIQLTLVPGLAYDDQGWRLGYGGGFYDRFLSGYTGISVGVTYQALMMDHIPHAGHDVPMQFVITEEKMIDCFLLRA